jgi:hypothetical protein
VSPDPSGWSDRGSYVPARSVVWGAPPAEDGGLSAGGAGAAGGTAALFVFTQPFSATPG